MKLSEIAILVEDKISSNSISLGDYITTESLLPNKEGKGVATNLPPVVCSLTHFREGDVLVANIRPYLKKVWFADKEGGCSSDVLVFRAKEGCKSSFLYAVLLQDNFFDHTMKGVKGSKMPRGDKGQIMRYELPIFSLQEQENIGNFVINIMKKIMLNRSINHNLEAMAKQLYDYWFLQFDFPDENGKPYKSNGGKMVWNEKLKREIPEGWRIATFNAFIEKHKGGDWGYDVYREGTQKVGCVRGADIIILNDVPTRYIKTKHEDKVLQDGDVVIEVSGGSPSQATGRIALITDGVIKRNGGTLVCSNFCLSFKLNKRIYSEYFFYLWKCLYDNKNMFNYEGKTSGIKNFQTDIFLANHWYEAPKEIIEAFHKIIFKYHSEIDQNIEENNKLTKLRDSLLPLLMNGQVKVGVERSRQNCE